MMFDEYLLSALFGLIVGLVGGYAGIGAAPLFIFLLGAFLSHTQHEVQGTVLAIMLGPMTLPAVWVMRDRVLPLLKYVLIGFLTYAGFSYLGAFLAYQFSSGDLHLLFASVLIALGVRSLISDRSRRKESRAGRHSRGWHLSLNDWTMTLLGASMGVIGGLFGIGAGVLTVPLLTWLFRMDKDDARAFSLAILLPPVSLGAVIKYNSMGDVLWPMAAVGFFGYFVSNYFGAKLGRAHNPGLFRLVMSILLIVLGVIYALQPR